MAGTTETYAYDGDGTRASRQVGTGPVTRYVADPAAALPVIVDDGTRTYVYGLGLAYAVAGSTLEVYHADRLGSVRELSNASGAVTATYRTDEWGIPTQTTGGSTQPFAYTGEPRDGTGLTYLRARSYDPALGRFTSRDTWPGSSSSPTTLNRYAYVGDNPTTRSDPSGHCAVDTIADVGFLGWDVISLLFGPPKERGANLTAFGLDLVGAAIPCATGLGFAYGGIRWVGRGERAAIDANKLHQIFGKAGRDLADLVAHFGSEEAAFRAVEEAAQAEVLRLNLTGVFRRVPVQVGSTQLLVSGNVIDGVARVGTFWKP